MSPKARPWKADHPTGDAEVKPDFTVEVEAEVLEDHLKALVEAVAAEAFNPAARQPLKKTLLNSRASMISIRPMRNSRKCLKNFR